MIKIINADYKSIINKIPNKSIDLILTDPPFEYVQGGMKSKRFNTGSWKSNSYTNTAMSSFKHDDIFTFLDLMIPKMKKS